MRWQLGPVNQAASGGKITFVIDTGFDDELTLPADWIERLKLHAKGSTPVELADGNYVHAKYYYTTLVWNGSDRTVRVLATAGGALVGMKLLKGCTLRVDVVPDSKVTISQRRGHS